MCSQYSSSTFLLFWHSKIFQAHPIHSLHQSRNHPFPILKPSLFILMENAVKKSSFGHKMYLLLLGVTAKPFWLSELGCLCVFVCACTSVSSSLCKLELNSYWYCHFPKTRRFTLTFYFSIFVMPISASEKPGFCYLQYILCFCSILEYVFIVILELLIHTTMRNRPTNYSSAFVLFLSSFWGHNHNPGFISHLD